jgi:DnaJ-class molecular chaperone
MIIFKRLFFHVFIGLLGTMPLVYGCQTDNIGTGDDKKASYDPKQEVWDPEINYYEVLEIDSDATETVINRAYKDAALENHPDKNAGRSEGEINAATEIFKKIGNAKETLLDKEKRKRYDQFIKSVIMKPSEFKNMIASYDALVTQGLTIGAIIGIPVGIMYLYHTIKGMFQQRSEAKKRKAMEDLIARSEHQKNMNS